MLPKVQIKKLEYHWYMEPSNVIISLCKKIQTKLISQAIKLEKRLGGTITTLAIKLGVHKRTIFRWKSYESKGMCVDSLIKICEYLDLPLEKLEKNGRIKSIGIISKKKHEKMIVNPKLPIKPTKELAELIGYVLSDGCITKNYSHFSYTSPSIQQIKRVKFLVNKIFGKVIWRYEGNSPHVWRILFPPLVGRVLKYFGGVAGNKATFNPHLPNWIIKTAPTKYLTAVFTDEGSSRLRVVKTKGHKFWSVLLHITHGRSRKITRELTSNIIKVLKKLIPLGKWISVGKLPEKVKEKILILPPPKLLAQEIMLLSKLGIETTNPKPMRIHRSKRNEFSCYWRFLVLQKSVKKFVKGVGFCEGTPKQNKLLKQFALFLQFYGKKLTDEDLKKYKLREF
jgi:hypothetical protein